MTSLDGIKTPKRKSSISQQKVTDYISDSEPNRAKNISSSSFIKTIPISIQSNSRTQSYYGSSNISGEEVLLKDARIDINELAAQSNEIVEFITTKARIYTALIISLTGYYLNILAYQIFSRSIKLYGAIIDSPDYVIGLIKSIKRFARILKDANVRELWLIEKKLQFRIFAISVRNLVNKARLFMRRYYLAFFIFFCIGFLSVSSAVAKTAENSFIGDVVSSHTYSSEKIDSISVAPGETLVTQGIINSDLTQNNQSLILAHVVKPGETVSYIATLYGVKSETVRFNNTIDDTTTSLKEGTTIYIPASDAYIYFASKDISKEELARIYSINISDIDELNPIFKGDASVQNGKLVFVPIQNFEEVKRLNLAELNRESQIAANEAANRRAAALANRAIVYTANVPDSLKANLNFQWPTDSRNVSCGWYCYGGHSAVDIIDGNGLQHPPIYAASSGVVTKIATGCGPFSGSCGNGYGNHVIVSHGDGWYTLYGHQDNIVVSVGQSVEKGQMLGTMGNSGNVWGGTGIHLHFEIHKDNQVFNPLSLLP
jgi:murein DD-endopeptidase MepM/ murein hydrolase activator NlpD